jgi:hypothetical protein
MTTHTLFDPRSIGTSLEPMEETGNLHRYLSESARPEIATVRRFWEHAFVDYPQAAKPAFVDRFRGGEFREALFELYVFSLLRAEGYRPEVLPEVADESTPDFAVTDSQGRRIYVEAFTVDCDPVLTHTEEMLAPLKDALGRLQPPFGLALKLRRSSKSPLPYGKIARAIDVWLASKAFVALATQANANGMTSVRRDFDKAGWQIEIEAHIAGPFSRPRRQRAGGVILCSTGVHYLDPARPLAKRLKNKAERYDVDGPLVLAVSPSAVGIHCEDIESVLYGPTWASHSLDGTIAIRRKGGGLWTKKDGTKHNRGIPAVIVCPNVLPATIGSVTPVSYQCPEPRQPLEGFLPRCTQATLADLEVRYSNGLMGREYFGLYDDWPHDRL